MRTTATIAASLLLSGIAPDGLAIVRQRSDSRLPAVRIGRSAFELGRSNHLALSLLKGDRSQQSIQGWVHRL
jgi:hypothetical protein